MIATVRSCVAAAVLPVTLVLALPAFAAQDARPDAGALHSLDVPGGTRALAAVLRINPDAPRARIMLTAIRVLWDVPDGQDILNDRRRADTRGYLESLAAFERARSALGPGPVTLALAADKRRREAMRTLADALGASLVESRKTWQLQPIETAEAGRRRTWLAAGGIAADGLLARLNAGEAVPLDRQSDTVPLPFPADVWQRVLDTPDVVRGSLLTSILGDRRAALLYYGAMAADPATRAFAVASPQLAEDLYDDLSSAGFALCGRSITLSGGRVAVPGGAPAVPLWEAVLGEPVTDPKAFVARLVSRDDGRIALLYDGIAHLDPAGQRFALGLDEAEPHQRKERFRALVEAAAVPLVGWNLRTRVNERVVFDATHVLMRTRVHADGRPQGPWHRRFWEAVFENNAIPDEDDAVLTDLAGGDTPDAAWLLGLVGVANTAARRDRAEAWAFAQRVFPSPTLSDLPDALVALRGFIRFRTLLLTLERMGVTAPATYAAAVRAADHVSRSGGERAWTTVTQFQAALTIAERARFARAIDADAADRLVRSLASVPLSDDREYLGGIATWIDRDLRPTFGAVVTSGILVDPDRPAETHVLAIMAGAVASSPHGDVARMPTVEWEGLLYRIDPAGSTLRRLMDVRQEQGGRSLDAVLTLARAAEAVLSIGGPEDVAARIADLTGAVAALDRAAPQSFDGRKVTEPNLADALKEARDRLRDVRRRPARDDLVRAVRDIRRATDWHLARVLASMAYAPHLGEPDSPALLGGDPSGSHDFGLAETLEDVRIRTMWQLAAESRDPVAGWRMAGSLLALDVALAQLALRRVPSEVMPEAPVVTDIERQAITEPVVLTSPFDQTEEARDALVAALRRGRERAAAAASSADTFVRVAEEAGLDEWRTQAIPWVLAFEPARLMDEWSLGELVRLGATSTGPQFDAWGGSGASADGSLTSVFPWRQPWTTLAGRKSSRMVPGMVPDLMIGLAEALLELKLPVRVSVGVLSVAAQDLLDTLRVNHADDWLSIVERAKAVTSGRLEDYVAALTIGGPLVPADIDVKDAAAK